MGEVSFPYAKKESSVFGWIRRPLALVELWSTLTDDWLRVPMIVDTGADYTLLPKYMALDLGIDLISDCVRQQTFGVGGTSSVFILKNPYPLRLGQRELRIPLGIIGQENVPPLLGRLKCLDVFDLRFHRFTTRFL